MRLGDVCLLSLSLSLSPGGHLLVLALAFAFYILLDDTSSLLDMQFIVNHYGSHVGWFYSFCLLDD